MREQQHNRPFDFKLRDLGENDGTMQIFDRGRIWIESSGQSGGYRQCLVLENNVPERKLLARAPMNPDRKVAHTERG